jgi:hypothetical protein
VQGLVGLVGQEITGREELRLVRNGSDSAQDRARTGQGGQVAGQASFRLSWPSVASSRV